MSVVIPTLDEAQRLGPLLTDLKNQCDVDSEVIVVDGGSSDHTVGIALEHGATVVNAPRGRGTQMNAGAEVAASPWLLFLHADSRLRDPDTLCRALLAIRKRTDREQSHRIAGHFRLKFIDVPPEARDQFRYLEAKTELNRRHTTNGDQGFLLSARFFRQLGGFDEEMHFLEDQRLARRIHETGRWITLPGELETSARRFATEGFGRRYFVMAVIMAVWDAGVDEFFDVAPELYRDQTEADELVLFPVFASIWKTMDTIGWQRSVQAWRRVGRYARENLWQVFFAVDVALRERGRDDRDLLQFHDRHVERLLDADVVDAVAAAGAFALVAGILPAWFWIKERGLSSEPA